MGALHEGHLSLIREAALRDDAVIVSIFVNPLQFGSLEDLAHYPRQLERDVGLATRAGATVIFAPSEVQMFPSGRPVISVDPGSYGELLEGSHRPGHMRGVATIVTKLLSLTRPDRAYFGEKDYEQLTLVRHLVDDLGLGVEIVGMPIVREADGLAMSSRNQRLNDHERGQATVLFRAITHGASVLGAGRDDLAAVEHEMAEVVSSEPEVILDYATVRRSSDLGVVNPLRGSLRILIAASVGPVRLIDNLALER